MPIENPNAPVPPAQYTRGSPKIILRAEIEEAQRNTKSNAGAARYLQVSYELYKRYATLYGLFDSHKNEAGIGIDKGFSHRTTSIPLRDVLAGKYPKYNRAKLKNRLVARKKIVEECSLCKFNERRVTDNKIPLMLTHKDGDDTNFALNNLHLLCYNCMFLTTGAPTVAHRRHIERSFISPDNIPSTSTIQPSISDHDVDNQAEVDNAEYILTDEEKRALLREVYDAL